MFTSVLQLLLLLLLKQICKLVARVEAQRLAAAAEQSADKMTELPPDRKENWNCTESV